MRMAFFYDQTRCMGCNSCTVACKDYYDVNPGQVRYRKLKTHELDNTEGVFYSMVMSCNHCESPACVASCGAGAITKRADGIVQVDRDKCINLLACITACPFAEPAIADNKQEPKRKDSWKVNHPMQKCGMCAELLDKGEKPVCVRACPMRAIEIGDFNELISKHPGAEQITIDKYRYLWENNTTNTGPSLIIKPRKPLKISGSL